MIDISQNFMKIQKLMYLREHQKKKKVKKGLEFYKKNIELINKVEKNIQSKRNCYFL